jgi:hypothetical protein
MFLDVGAGGIIGASLGLLVGLLVMWALCRYLLAPLLRKFVLSSPSNLR